jgi:hypothetical protein
MNPFDDGSQNPDGRHQSDGGHHDSDDRRHLADPSQARIDPRSQRAPLSAAPMRRPGGNGAASGGPGHAPSGRDAGQTVDPAERRLDAGRERWWKQYLCQIADQGVPKNALIWHRRRIEQLLARQPGVHSSAWTGAQVEAYFRYLDGLHLAHWQLSQALDAIQRFAKNTGCGWAGAVDWDFWHQQWPTTEALDPEFVASLEHGTLPADPTLRDFSKCLRLQQRSLRTEQTYVDWVQRCTHYHRLADPSALQETHVGPFLTYLTSEREVSASTQRQALNALVCFFKEIHGVSTIAIGDFRPSNKPRQVPTVLSLAEVRQVLAEITEPTLHLAASLLFG